MSKTGLAHRPGTAVLPTCSSVSCSSEAAARMRAASARKRNGQRSSYSTSRTVPDSRPSESCDMLMKKECTNSSPVDFGTAHSTHMKPVEGSMSKLRVHNFAISLDGYGAGPRQGRAHPLGVGGEELHGWYVGTRAVRQINGKTGGAGGRPIQVGGGASTVRQYLQARLSDEIHVAIAPILLGSGEALFAGMDLPALGYACTEHVATPAATHVVLARKT